MGFQTGNRKGPVSDINVTPLVDVMLVLLVIFMVTAPMMFSGVNLKLPKTGKVSSLNLRPELIILSVTAGEEYFLGKERIPKETLLKVVSDKLKSTKSDVIYLRADYALKYEKVAKLISALKNAGISNIALVTEIEKSQG
ncbi:MAG: biopolymer transporter ExbD [Bacteriovoracaceae bacterium]|nr:biopolymer transporter ExbD [Bacteriovoracaceae bacterium]